MVCYHYHSQSDRPLRMMTTCRSPLGLVGMVTQVNGGVLLQKLQVLLPFLQLKTLQDNSLINASAVVSSLS